MNAQPPIPGVTVVKPAGKAHNYRPGSQPMLGSLALLLAASGGNTYTPTFPGGIVAWFVCNSRKRQEFGGWLLFFYWQLYSGIIVTAIFFWINFESYVPENFDKPAKYYLFLASAVPVIVLFLMQAAVATILISVRTWDLLVLLRWLVMAQVIAALVAVVIDAAYLPENVALTIAYTLLPESLWLAYFFRSRRVRHVFQLHDWDMAVQQIHPTETKLVI